MSQFTAAARFELSRVSLLASPIQSEIGCSNLSEIRPIDLNIEHGATPKDSPWRPKPNGTGKESDGVGYLATSGVE